jgi:hypothetical protein
MQLGVTYLLDRGIDEATILREGIEITNPDLELIVQRLGKDIADVSQKASAIVWFPVYSVAGDSLGWIARPLPTLASGPKFLTPVNGTAPPYLPLSLCHGKLPAASPLIITEGPVKALAFSRLSCGRLKWRLVCCGDRRTRPRPAGRTPGS